MRIIRISNYYIYELQVLLVCSIYSSQKVCLMQMKYQESRDEGNVFKRRYKRVKILHYDLPWHWKNSQIDNLLFVDSLVS